jgi:hypothetical protein
MKKSSDPHTEQTLLDALLQDEAWRSGSAAFKAEALGAYQTHLRTRRLTRWSLGMVALAVVTCMVHWLVEPAASPRRQSFASAKVPKPAGQLRHLTDGELLAAFPKGSCFIAEVDGKKELIFVDPQAEHTFVVRSGVSANQSGGE